MKDHDNQPIPNNYEQHKVEPFDTVTISKVELDNIVDNLELQIDFVLKFLLVSNVVIFVLITTLAIIVFA